MNMRTMACAVALILAQGAAWASGVTRSAEPISGGCRVTLAWELSGKVGSDLILEERFAPGWSVVSSTVPFASLDATWFSGSLARFAVKPELLAKAGSISFVVRSAAATSSGSVSGDWQMYLGGKLLKDSIAGSPVLSALAASSDDQASAGTDSPAESAMVETAVVISSFRILDDSRIALSYAGLAKAGTLVVEGCEGLGKAWTRVAELKVAEGDGNVELKQGKCSFYRMKLLTEEN